MKVFSLFLVLSFVAFGNAFYILSRKFTPDDNNKIVLSNGNSKGLIESIPIGGHFAPNSTVGANAL